MTRPRPRLPDGAAPLAAILARMSADDYQGCYGQEELGDLHESGADWRARRFGQLLARYADPDHDGPEDRGYDSERRRRS
jgi:hypothetical protein